MLNAIMKRFDRCGDFVLRRFPSGDGEVCICYIRGLADREYLSSRVIKPIMEQSGFDGDFTACVQAFSVSPVNSADEAEKGLLDGQALAVFGARCCLINASAPEKRSPQEPDSDVTVRGPKIGFTEDGETSMALLRRTLRTPELKSETITVGTVTNTRVTIVWLNGRADDRLVSRIKAALETAVARGLTDSGNIETLIGGVRLLPAFGSSEKTDTVASKLVAGRVGVICDGSPFVLTAPYVFAESLQSADDYYRTPWYASFMRILRLLALLISVFLPGMFCAAYYHSPQTIPPAIYSSVLELKEVLPLPLWAEVIAALPLCELLREVGVRMPQRVGDAVGIVGSLILGDAAVSAGLIAPTTVMLVALAAVTAFIVPVFMYASLIMRYLLVFIGAATGFPGIAAAAAVIICAMAAEDSFGTPYMKPIMPYSRKGMQDFLIAIPKKTLFRREDV